MKLSIVVPIYNELENIPLLHRELTDALSPTGMSYELLFVDDGSRDASVQRLTEIAESDSHVRVLRFRRNYGQTAAMQAGLENARGDVIVTIDGDLQNDPRDIPMMVAKLDEGYDLVHGWRRHRQDAWLNRKLPSKIANRLISWSTDFPIHDLGCTLKAIRREIADELELYGQMHRFIPILAAQRGARCAEVVTHHRARQFGQTKYGITRTLQVILDLFTVKYMLDYFANPMRLFGRLAAACVGVGALSGAATLWMKWQRNIDMTGNPLLLLTIVCWLTGLQLVSMGLLGEVSARIFYQREKRRPFAIAEEISREDVGVRRAA
ncbi:MAG: glycosyltransferase family 2 protein [Planctomycetales bacterium]|nr:glycosyltransferase family 2 protein [Planctomycetales bacterium]